jgi:hypothetical protein
MKDQISTYGQNARWIPNMHEIFLHRRNIKSLALLLGTMIDPLKQQQAMALTQATPHKTHTWKTMIFYGV